MGSREGGGKQEKERKPYTGRTVNWKTRVKNRERRL